MPSFATIAGTAAAAFALSATSAMAQNRPAPSRPQAPAPSATAPQVARPAAPQQSQIPQAAGLVVLIKGSLIALNQANQTGNYTVLHALGSDNLRRTANPQSLAQSFAGFRQRNVDLSPVIYLNPNLTRPAAIEGGRLHLVGTFPTQPMQITFDFWFEPSQGQWKFIQLNAGLVPVRAQQQPPQPQRPPQPPQRR